MTRRGASALGTRLGTGPPRPIRLLRSQSARSLPWTVSLPGSTHVLDRQALGPTHAISKLATTSIVHCSDVKKSLNEHVSLAHGIAAAWRCWLNDMLKT